MKRFFLLTITLITIISNLSAQQKSLTPLEQRANDVVSVLNEPKDFEKVFAPSFLAALPPEQIKAVSTQLLTNFGKALRVTSVVPKNEYAGEISILFEKNTIVKMNLTLEANSPNLISGLLVTATEKTSNTFDDIIGELKKLPGQTSLTVAKLNDKNLEPVAVYNNEKPLAIGSSFKLYILSELVRSIAAGERHWSDVIELNEFSLPSGMLQGWEKGAPITLHTLASMMISLSDNTATDQLLTTLGREKVEKMVSVAGNSNSDLNFPFLKTGEMFKLKGSGSKNFAAEYLAKDTAGKRAMLNGEVAAFKLTDIDLANFMQKPAYISQIEWFASTDDLARVMNWLRMNTEKSPLDKARGVLTINKVLAPADAQNWKYIGYKGGSETGVMSMTFLLLSKKGEWFVVSATWNDENAPVNEGEFAALVLKTVKILQEKTQ